MILLRHGETIFNVIYGSSRQDPGIHDPPLTENGRDQAARAAEALREHEVTRLIASPYQRALQTGDIIASALGIPLAVEPMVRERFAFSCDVGTPTSLLRRSWAQYAFDHLDEVWWPEAEEPEHALHGRCRDFAARLHADDDWSTVLVVTHWGVIRSLTGERVKNCEMIRCDPARLPPAP